MMNFRLIFYNVKNTVKSIKTFFKFPIILFLNYWKGEKSASNQEIKLVKNTEIINPYK